MSFKNSSGSDTVIILSGFFNYVHQIRVTGVFVVPTVKTPSSSSFCSSKEILEKEEVRNPFSMKNKLNSLDEGVHSNLVN